MIPEELNRITEAIIGAAIAVHRTLGPGLLESVYETCLAHELTKRGLSVECQQTLPVRYDTICVESGYRIDLLVEDLVIVELKSVDKMIPLYESQLLTYLRLSGRRLGLLINFNVIFVTDGIKRMAL